MRAAHLAVSHAQVDDPPQSRDASAALDRGRGVDRACRGLRGVCATQRREPQRGLLGRRRVGVADRPERARRRSVRGCRQSSDRRRRSTRDRRHPPGRSGCGRPRRGGGQGHGRHRAHTPGSRASPAGGAERAALHRSAGHRRDAERLGRDHAELLRPARPGLATGRRHDIRVRSVGAPGRAGERGAGGRADGGGRLARGDPDPVARHVRVARGVLRAARPRLLRRRGDGHGRLLPLEGVHDVDLHDEPGRDDRSRRRRRLHALHPAALPGRARRRCRPGACARDRDEHLADRGDLLGDDGHRVAPGALPDAERDRALDGGRVDHRRRRRAARRGNPARGADHGARAHGRGSGPGRPPRGPRARWLVPRQR